MDFSQLNLSISWPSPSELDIFHHRSETFENHHKYQNFFEFLLGVLPQFNVINLMGTYSKSTIKHFMGQVLFTTGAFLSVENHCPFRVCFISDKTNSYSCIIGYKMARGRPLVLIVVFYPLNNMRWQTLQSTWTQGKKLIINGHNFFHEDKRIQICNSM